VGVIKISMPERDSEETVPDPVEQAGETTAAASVPTPADTRPVGDGTTVNVERDDES
jgi:hypothetical protein